MHSIAESSTRFWDHIAEKYAQKPVADMPAYERKLAATKKRLQPTDVILDIGCGTGSLAVELAPHVAQVHAIDLSGEMIKIAKRRAENAQIHNIAFEQTTLDTQSAYSPESFDVICAYNILHLVDDLAATLQMIHRLLKPGGSFISSTTCLSESWIPFGLILPVMRWVGKAPSVLMLRVQQLDDAMQTAGFVERSSLKVNDAKTLAFILAKKSERASE